MSTHGRGVLGAATRDGLQPVSVVAEYLALSRSKVYQLMEAGDLRFVKLGKSRRIRWSDVLELVEQNTISANR